MIYHIFLHLFPIDGQLFCCHLTIIINLMLLSPSSSCFLRNKLDKETLFGKQLHEKMVDQCPKNHPARVWMIVSIIKGLSDSSVGKDLPAMWETPVRFLGWEDLLEKG